MIDMNTLQNPYPGLRSFAPRDFKKFYGRDAQIAELARKIKRNRMISILGASGSGKSSLVRAGLLPHLDASIGGNADNATRAWLTTEMTPGGQPLTRLAQAVYRLQCQLDEDSPASVSQPGAEFNTSPTVAGDEYVSMAEALLSRSSMGLVELIKSLHVDLPVLILVDQFEELFRIRSNNSNRNVSLAFIKILLEAVSQTGVPVYVVITMRSDFLGDCTKFEGLPEAINRSQYLIPRMNRQQRKEIVIGPLSDQGVKISSRLVNRLLNDMGDDPDQLPIFQHALMRMWWNWFARKDAEAPLDLEHYQAIGTMTNALNNHADATYRQLDARQKVFAEKLFRALSEKTKDSLIIRRPALAAELADICECSLEELLPVLNLYRDKSCCFLMPGTDSELTATTIIDVSHESLFRVWQRARQWVDEEARAAEEYSRLAEAATRHTLGEVSLMRYPELGLAIQWRQHTKPNQFWAARYNAHFDLVVNYLEQSIQQDRDDKHRIEEQRLKELATEKKIRRFKLGLLAFAIAGVVVLALFSLNTHLLKLKAESFQFAMHSQTATVQSPELGALKALIALAKYDTLYAQNALNQAYMAMNRRSVHFIDWTVLDEMKEWSDQHASPPTILASRLLDDNSVLSITSTGHIVRWQLDNQLQATRPPTVFYDSGLGSAAITAHTMDLTPARTRVNIALANKANKLRVIRYDIASNRLAIISDQIVEDNATVSALTFNKDGSKLAVGDYLGNISLIHNSGDELLQQSFTTSHSEAISSLAFNADGKFLASGGWDARVLIHNTGNLALHAELIAVHSVITSVRFKNLDANRLVSGDANGTIHLWNVAGRRSSDTITCSHAPIVGLAFDAADSRLICGSKSGSVKVLSTANDRFREKIDISTRSGHTIGSMSLLVETNPDSKTTAQKLLISSEAGVSLWKTGRFSEGGVDLDSITWHSSPHISQDDKWLAAMVNRRRVDIYRASGSTNNISFYEKTPVYRIVTPADFTIGEIAFFLDGSANVFLIRSMEDHIMEYQLDKEKLVTETRKRLKSIDTPRECIALLQLQDFRECQTSIQNTDREIMSPGLQMIFEKINRMFGWMQ